MKEKTAIVQIPKIICEECKKREATRLCDYEIGHNIDLVGPGKAKRVTCDKKLCVKCATKINNKDYCKKHIEAIIQELGGVLSKRKQSQERYKNSRKSFTNGSVDNEEYYKQIEIGDITFNAIKNIVSDYKRVLKENELLKQQNISYKNNIHNLKEVRNK